MAPVSRSLTLFLLETISEPPNLIHIIIEHASRPSVLQHNLHSPPAVHKPTKSFPSHSNTYQNSCQYFSLPAVHLKVLLLPQSEVFNSKIVYYNIWTFSYYDTNAKKLNGQYYKIQITIGYCFFRVFIFLCY